MVAASVNQLRSKNTAIGGMGDTLVAIDERVIHREAIGERADLVHDGGVQVGAVEGGLGLRQRRLEAPEIPKPLGAAAGTHEGSVERDHLAQGEVAHLREATIEFEVLRENALRRGLESRVRGRQQVGHRRACKILDRHAESLGLGLKLGGLAGRQFNGDLHVVTVARHPPANKRLQPTTAGAILSRRG